MTQKQIAIGVFSNTLHSDSLRGANRLFHAIYNGLKARDDVRIILLDSMVPNEISPNGTLYYGRDLNNPQVPQTPRASTRLSLEDVLQFVRKLRRGLRRARGYYKRYVPYYLRVMLRPAADFFLRIFNNSYHFVENKLQEAYEPLARRGLERLSVRELVILLLFRPENPFTNADIKPDAFDLAQLDVIVNFWWFHLPFENPMFAVTVPVHVPVYSWFLDASPLRLPHWQEGLINETEFRRGVQAHLRASTRVVAISHSAARDASLFFGMKPQDVTTIPCGVFPQDFTHVFSPEMVQGIFAKQGMDAQVKTIMVLGVQEPTKNVVNILKALFMLSQRSDEKLQCIFIGAHHGFVPSHKFGAVIDKMPAHVKLVFAGSVTEHDKCAIMQHCALLLYPSVWEGFGIPPLEAMAMRVPVVTSDVASLPEVCGEHAFYCDPYDPKEMADVVQHVLHLAPEAREAHVAAAQDYARQWLWDVRATPMLIDDIRTTLEAQKAHAA